MKKQRREVEQAKKRIVELDRIFKRIYEDDISGTISHERFLKLSAEYETEQRELTNKAAQMQQEVNTYEQDKADCCPRTRQEQRETCAESRHCLEFYRYDEFPKRAAKQNKTTKEKTV